MLGMNVIIENEMDNNMKEIRDANKSYLFCSDVVNKLSLPNSFR
jgi:hypothetical protein